MRIIVLEDEQHWNAQISEAIASEEWQCETHDNPHSFLDRVKAERFDLAILDVLLGDHALRGTDVLQQMREAGNRLPVLVLTQFATHERAAQALDLGADDHLAKPFGAVELRARLRAMVRRARPVLGKTVEFGPLTISRQYRTAQWNDQRIELRDQGFDILALLAEAQGEPVSHEELWRAVWSKWDKLPPQQQPIQAGMSRLRKELSAAGCGDLIRTLPGLGYRLALA